MKGNGIYSKVTRRYKATTNYRHNLPIAPNREFRVKRLARKMVNDITYIPTEEDGCILLEQQIYVVRR